MKKKKLPTSRKVLPTFQSLKKFNHGWFSLASFRSKGRNLILEAFDCLKTKDVMRDFNEVFQSFTCTILLRLMVHQNTFDRL